MDVNGAVDGGAPDFSESVGTRPDMWVIPGRGITRIRAAAEVWIVPFRGEIIKFYLYRSDWGNSSCGKFKLQIPILVDSKCSERERFRRWLPLCKAQKGESLSQRKVAGGGAGCVVLGVRCLGLGAWGLACATTWISGCLLTGAGRSWENWRWGAERSPSTAMCNGSKTSTVSKFKETKAEMFLFSSFSTAAAASHEEN